MCESAPYLFLRWWMSTTLSLFVVISSYSMICSTLQRDMCRSSEYFTLWSPFTRSSVHSYFLHIVCIEVLYACIRQPRIQHNVTQINRLSISIGMWLGLCEWNTSATSTQYIILVLSVASYTMCVCVFVCLCICTIGNQIKVLKQLFKLYQIEWKQIKHKFFVCVRVCVG